MNEWMSECLNEWKESTSEAWRNTQNIVENVLILNNNRLITNIQSESRRHQVQWWCAYNSPDVKKFVSVLGLRKMSSDIVAALYWMNLRHSLLMRREWPETSSREVQRHAICSSLLTTRDLTPAHVSFLLISSSTIHLLTFGSPRTTEKMGLTGV